MSLFGFGDGSFDNGKVIRVNKGRIGSCMKTSVEGSEGGKIMKIKGIKILVLAFFVGEWGLKLI